MEMLEETDAAGLTAYLLACRHGQDKIVKTLIQHGEANIQAKDASKKNGFKYACLHSHSQVVNLLVELTGEKEVNPNEKDKYGFTPFILACENGHLQ